MTYRLLTGDARKEMSTLEDNGVDVVLTDPPYGLDFMGQEWDYAVPGVVYWQEAYRVAKPGALLLAFGGTRTFHRLTCAIEDAGWEIRDVLMWLYSSGMPKSHDISKALDKAAGAEREVIGRKIDISTGRTMTEGQARGGRSGSESDGWDRPWRSDGERLTANCLITAPATPEAKQWSGYGTGLKPAWEPIILAQKPLDGTYVENALRWGMAGLNIDAARVPITDGAKLARNNPVGDNGWKNSSGGPNRAALYGEPAGRWPANLITDGADPVLSRYFYVSKASQKERTCAGSVPNSHPTVKPLALLEYLVALSKPPTAKPVFLDPFCGSGTTGIAVALAGADFIGIDCKPEYLALTEARIQYFTGGCYEPEGI